MDFYYHLIHHAYRVSLFLSASYPGGFCDGDDDVWFFQNWKRSTTSNFAEQPLYSLIRKNYKSVLARTETVSELLAKKGSGGVGTISAESSLTLAFGTRFGSCFAETFSKGG
jgi:hypothetical protein